MKAVNSEQVTVLPEVASCGQVSKSCGA